MTRFEPVPAKPDHVELEHRILALWESEATFDQLRAQNAGNEPWSFIDGPITANNPMGVHHAWGRSLKDVYQRFHALQGRDQRYQNGFDCQGLWVEVEVEKALGLNSKREIEEFGLDRFARACRDRVAEYSGVQTRQSIRLGQWMDWDNSYFTMTDANIGYIWTFLAECYRRGWLYVGHRSMPWCPRCGTSLSQHELIDSYADITHPSVYIRLPLLEREHEYLIVWTTTPWTLPANVAAAVHPDEDYVRIETLAGVAIVAEKRLEDIPIHGKTLGTIKGSELVGLRYSGPFDDLAAQQGIEHRVVAWDEVSTEEGTGIVHIAPGCGAEDFDLGKREQLAVLVPIDESGAFYNEYGWLHGLHAAEVAQQVLGDLGERGRLVEAGELTHRYPTCWRCHTELVYRVVDEWFISSDQIRAPMIEAARTVTWQPEHYGKRMEDWLNNMGDWCISRKRYWGLPLPFWFCDDKHMTVVSSKAELLERAVSGADDLVELHRPWIDDVVISCTECGGEATRLTDVGDCWLDAGIVPFSTLGWNNATTVPAGYAEGAGEGLTGADLPDHAYWETWFPADWISESREQIRLWFYSLLFMSVALTGKAPYRRVLGYERVTDETGRPMHKSWGNAIWFDDAIETIGADVMRWMYCGAEPSRNFGFGYTPANEVKRKLLTQWNVYRFLVDYATIDGWKPSPELLDGPTGVRELDRWMVARTRDLVARTTDAYASFDTPRIVRELERFTDDLSNWYLRLSRARFWRSDDDDADKRSAYETLWYALATLQRVQSPVVPFISDELWRNLASPFGLASSVHLAGWPLQTPTPEDLELLADMALVRTVVELGRAARADAKIKTRQPLASMTIASEDADARARITKHAELIARELSLKEIHVAASAEAFATVEVVPNFKVLGPKLGQDVKKIVAKIKAGDFELVGGRVRVDDVTLEPGEFEMRTRAKEGLAVADGEGFACALDTTLTPELQLEGAARDLVRAIQEQRKAANLNLTDRIVATYPATQQDVVDSFGTWIADEVLAIELVAGDAVAVEVSANR